MTSRWLQCACVWAANPANEIDYTSSIEEKNKTKSETEGENEIIIFFLIKGCEFNIAVFFKPEKMSVDVLFSLFIKIL